MQEKQPCRHQGQCRRRGRRCPKCQSRDSPAARGEDHGESGCASAAHGGPWQSRYPPAARGRPHAGAGGCPTDAVTLWRAHTGAGSWQDLWPHEERSPRRSRFAGRACDPVGDPHWSSLFLKDCTPWEAPTLGQGQSVRSPPHDENGAAEITSDELLATPTPRPSASLGARRWRNSEVKLSPGKNKGWGEGVLRFVFIFSLPYSDLICNKFPQVESVLPTTVIAEYSPCCYLDPLAFRSVFLSSARLRRGVIEWLWWAPGIQPGSIHHNFSEGRCFPKRHKSNSSQPGLLW